MKRLAAGVLCLLFLFSLPGCNKMAVKHPYVQEYIAGQGNIQGTVDVEGFSRRDARFAIGATRDGYAVFKDPAAAYDALLENYSDGLKLIREEFGLKAVSPSDYLAYKTYGWQVSTGTPEAQEQARFISSFFDIYENSFA